MLVPGSFASGEQSALPAIVRHQRAGQALAGAARQGPRIVQPTLAIAVATASGVQAQSSGGEFRRFHPASQKACSRPPGAITSRMVATSEVTK